MTAYLDPNKGLRSQPGNPPKFDPQAKAEMKAEVKQLQSSSNGSKPEPPKRKALEAIMVKYATDTVKRAGRVLLSGENVSISKTTIK